jgi:hypothetical protein
MLGVRFLFSAVIAAILVLGISAQTTEFSYQGSLKDGVNAANGNYDFEFALFDALTAGAQVGSTLTRAPVAVSSGIFTVPLDFGSVFPGASRFLELRVRPTGGGPFNTLSPRQRIDSAPYSVKSLTTDTAATATTATTAVTATNSTQLNGQADTFYRDATNLNAGTVANARTTGTSANTANTLVLRNASGGFNAGAVTLSGAITLPTTTRRYAIPTAGFVPGGTGAGYSQFPSFIYGTSPGQLAEFSAPLNLPDGATVTEVRFYLIDNDATQSFVLLLHAKPLTAVTTTVIGSANSGGTTSPNVQQIVLSNGVPFVVDNDTTAYSIEAQWTIPATFADLKIASARISYTLTSPLP